MTTYSLHPGAVDTELSRNSFAVKLLKLVARFAFKDAKGGAQTTIYCAVAEELEGVTGKYFRLIKMSG